MNRKVFLISEILTNVFAISFGIFFTGRTIALENQAAINSFLNVKEYETVDENGNKVETTYFDSDFSSVKEVKEQAKTITKKVTDEGIVLLKNNTALPLKEKAKINTYSISCVDPVYTGTGSSGADTSTAIDFKSALESHFSLNQTLYSSYKSLYESKQYGRGASSGIGATFNIHEVPWSVLDESKNDAADAGIFFLCRNGGEGEDLDISTGDKTDMSEGNYLRLSPQEKDVLSHLKELKGQGKLAKIIIFMNASNPVQTDFLEEYDVDALLYSSTLGETGAQSFSDILTGEINPSGRLTDTFFKDNSLNPVYSNFGDYTYEGTKVSNQMFSNKYVVYQESIYNGYRYCETRYEDSVLKKENVGAYSYFDTVSYPFGYGLSYSDFAYSDFKVTDEGENFTISVKVTNQGNVKGKHAVELYLQKPYTGRTEQSAIELIAFDKTDELGQGQSQDFTFTVSKRNLTSYDFETLGSYLLEGGDYYFTVANDAHQAINNILSLKTSADLVTLDNEKQPDRNAVQKFTLSEDDVSYTKTIEGDDICNQFDNVNLNRYQHKGTNSVTYLSRSDWEHTIHQHVTLTGNLNMKNDCDYDNTNGMEDDTTQDYPNYGQKDTDYDLIDVKDIPYDDSKWDDLLNQLTLDEQVTLLSSGLRSTSALASIDKPGTIDHNGSNGPMMPYNVSSGSNRGLAVSKNDPDQDQTPIVYPSNTLAACTYNLPLMEEYGQTWGEDCLWAGYSGLYGPAVNIHRGCYGGRAFEYYSEDPLLSGKIAASMVRGIQSKGVYCYLKHCLLNEQETNREGINTWADEQTIREIYLKPFEIAIKEGGCKNVMTGFNRLGTLWNGNQGFLNHVLRGEFHMSGFAVSDFFHKEYMNLSAGIYHGNDLPDGQADVEELKNNADNNPGLAIAVRESVHRILYTVVNSNAMNNMRKGTRIVSVTPYWIILINTFTILTGTLTLCFFSLLIVAIVIKPKKHY